MKVFIFYSIKGSELNDSILTKEAMDNVVTQGGTIQTYGKTIKRDQAGFSLNEKDLNRKVQLNLFVSIFLVKGGNVHLLQAQES